MWAHSQVVELSISDTHTQGRTDGFYVGRWANARSLQLGSTCCKIDSGGYKRESTYGLVAQPKTIHVVSLRCVPNEKQFPPPPRTSNSPSEMWQVWLCRRRGRPPTVGCRKDMVRLNSGSSQLSTHMS